MKRASIYCLLVLSMLLTACDLAPATPTPVPTSTIQPATPTPQAVSPLEASFIMAPYITNGQIQVSVYLTNRGSKDISATTGTLSIRDKLFDRVALSSEIDVVQNIPAGQFATWIGYLPLNQLDKDQMALLQRGKDGLTVTYTPSQVVFADGTRQRFP